MITLTPKAVAEIKSVITDQGMKLEEQAIAVRVRGGGCSGFQYHMEFVNKADIDRLNDWSTEIDGLTVTVDGRSDLYLNGTEVDWKDDINGRGFKFSNPNSKGCCGCGSSFQA